MDFESLRDSCFRWRAGWTRDGRPRRRDHRGAVAPRRSFTASRRDCPDIVREIDLANERLAAASQSVNESGAGANGASVISTAGRHRRVQPARHLKQRNRAGIRIIRRRLTATAVCLRILRRAPSSATLAC